MKTRAIILHKNGDADQMIWDEVNLSDPEIGQVLVKHEFVGFNMIDTYHRSGIYPSPSKPCFLGTEASGVIERVGPGVVLMLVTGLHMREVEVVLVPILT